VVAKKDDSDSSSSSDSDSDSDDDEDAKKKGGDKMKVDKTDDDSSSSSSDSDSDDDSDATPDSELPEGGAGKRKQEDVVEPPAKKQAFSDDTEGSCKIYIRGLPWRATEEEVQDFFKACGSGPKSVELPLQDDGRSSGTAIVDFHDADGAAAAMELNGEDFNGRWLSIKYSTPKPINAPRELTEKQAGCLTVFIGNLAWDIDEDTLREAFKDCGTISQVRFATDRETGDFKGFGHIEFEETEATDAAVKLAGTDICGRAIRVDFANDKRAGGGFGGGTLNLSIEIHFFLCLVLSFLLLFYRPRWWPRRRSRWRQIRWWPRRRSRWRPRRRYVDLNAPHSLH
jgi:nucleolin